MKKILIVDDDTDILLLMKTNLTKKGYDVSTTTTCSEGLNIFYSVTPDLLLLDINVGNEDGREMCREIKLKADYNHIPVILCSANPILLKDFAKYEANEKLDKPFNLELLDKIIKKYI